MPSQSPDGHANACVESGIWTPIPVAPPTTLSTFTLKLSAVDASENNRIKKAGLMTFHMTGCTGDFSDHEPQAIVADAMAAQVQALGSVGLRKGPATTASFLFHLGDVVYKDDNKADPARDDQKQMYNAQFYAPYTNYGRSILAIAGNHDGKYSDHAAESAIDHFLLNFCAAVRNISPDNTTDKRPAMIQPYVYWRLSTPLAYVIGLYSNIANSGILDDPAQSRDLQYQWLVAQLQDVKKRNASRTQRKAVLLAVHYPPYSGTANFVQRGDPTLGKTPGAQNAQPLGDLLQRAIAASGQRPDAVFSAHAHLYQRLTYRYADGWEVPYLVVGSGGHAPVESMWAQCNDKKPPVSPKTVPFDAVLPKGLTLPAGDNVQVVAYDDQSFGFLRLTIAAGKLTGEFFVADARSLTLADAFALDMNKHQVASAV
jgi:Calcineurin-like phosphoesterase